MAPPNDTFYKQFEENDNKDNEINSESATKMPWEAPGKQGLYDPQNEHEACGVGFIVAIDGKRNHKVCMLNFYLIAIASSISLFHYRFSVMLRHYHNV